MRKLPIPVRITQCQGEVAKCIIILNILVGRNGHEVGASLFSKISKAN